MSAGSTRAAASSTSAAWSAVIDGLKADFGIKYLCEKLGVSESGYHARTSRPV